MTTSLAGTAFRAISNSSNGSLDTQTVMRFVEDGEIILGTYGGGTILTGQVLATRNADDTLDMLYQGATLEGDIQAGRAVATFVDEPDGRHMHLTWRWLTGDLSEGRSSWVQVPD